MHRPRAAIVTSRISAGKTSAGKTPAGPKAWPALLALALAAAACTNGSDTATSEGATDLERTDVQLTSGLETVANCDTLLERLVQEGLDRVGPYGFGQGGYPIMMAEDALAGADAATADSAEQSEGPADFTRTNVQEAGVDEPDLVKTDGDRMVVAAAGKLQILDVSTGVPVLVRTVTLPEDQWAGDLFLLGDTAYLTTSGWTELAFAPNGSYPRFGGTPTTRLVEVDLDTGTIGRTLEFEGSSISAREIDGTIRFVLSAPTGRFAFLYPSGPEAEDSAKKANEDLIRNSTIEQWLPSYRLVEGGATIEQGPIVACDHFHLPREFSGFGTVAVLTVDASSGLDPVDAVAVLTDGQTIYASMNRLTVATQRWPEWNPDGTIAADSDFSARLHHFDITDPTATTYVGSGSVRGHLLSQYSLSEFDGHLRVATTDGDPWGGTTSSESFITVFEERDGELAQIGQVGGLGKSEQIYAVRFLGPQAFVVTFRQTDPLYSVDLSDPTAPRVVGELKIPGYSAYLHPVGDGTLIGIGQDASELGTTQGTQISVFDVTDPANPQRVAQLMLGENTYSAVEGDARAFTWLADRRMALVPISWWGWDEESQTDNNGSSAVVVRLNEDGTLTELGRVGHPVTEQCERGIMTDDDIGKVDGTPASGASATSTVSPDYCWRFQPEIRRTVVVGQTLYTISDAGVKANALDGLAETAWVPFT